VLCLTIATGQNTPKATIHDVAWMAGRWQGEGLGGLSEEHWSAPAGGTMMGMYRLVKDGKIVFYEFFRIAEEEGSLTLRLKHFHPDMKGWEEKDNMVTFPLVRIAKDEALFDGIAYQRTGRDSMVATVMMGKKGETPKPVKFVYRRMK
jgi:hypothetical protein